jgi:hypothetical protein
MIWVRSHVWNAFDNEDICPTRCSLAQAILVTIDARASPGPTRAASSA